MQMPRLPLCGCPERKFTRLIIDFGKTGSIHRQISGYLLNEFGIDIYPADLLSFLEDAVHVFEAIRISPASSRRKDCRRV